MGPQKEKQEARNKHEKQTAQKTPEPAPANKGAQVKRQNQHSKKCAKNTEKMQFQE